MRRIAVLVIVFVLLPVGAVAQEGGGAVVWENAPLDRVLSEFSSVSGVELVYAVKTVRNVRVSGRYVRGENPRAQLNRLLEGTGIRAQRIREGQYVLIKEPISLDVLGDNPRFYTGTMEGRVVDASTGEPLPDANVVLVDVGLGAPAKENGDFSIPDLPAGTYVVRVSHVGYRPVRLELTVYPASPRRPPEIRLQPEVLHANREARVTDGVEPIAPPPGSVDFDAAQASVVPFALAESDLATTLDWLPGVSRTGGAYGSLVVRGGRPDQTLSVRNGVPIYDGLHLLGMISPFQPEGLSRVRFYRGAMPAGIGGGTSGVLQVESRDGLVDSFTGLAGVDPLTMRAIGQIPLSSTLGVYASVRRSTLGALLQPRIRGDEEVPSVVEPVGNPFWNSEEHPDLSFMDAEGRVTARLSSTARLDVDGYVGTDSFRDSDGQLRPQSSWGSHAVSAQLRAMVGDRTLVEGLVYDTESHFDSDSSESSIHENAVRVDAEHFISLEHQVRGGASLARRRVDGGFPGEHTDVSGYGQWTWRPLDALELQSGLRVEAMVGGDASNTNVDVSPRLSARWTVQPDHLILRAGIGRLTQAVHRLRADVPGRFVEPFEPWVLASERSHAWFAGAGVEWAPVQSLLFSIDAFGRRSAGEPALPPPSIPGAMEGEIGLDDGRAVGLEVAARYQTGPWTVGASYTLSRAERRDGEADFSVWEIGPYDRPHLARFLIERRDGRVGASLRMDVESGVPDGTGGRTSPEVRLSLAFGTRFHALGLEWEGSIRALTRPATGSREPLNGFHSSGILADLQSTPPLPLISLTARW